MLSYAAPRCVIGCGGKRKYPPQAFVAAAAAATAKALHRTGRLARIAPHRDDLTVCRFEAAAINNISKSSSIPLVNCIRRIAERERDMK